MVDERDDGEKKEDLFDKEEKFDAFTPEGEALGYISLEQARLVAMQTARDDPGNYGSRFSGVRKRCMRSSSRTRGRTTTPSR